MRPIYAGNVISVSRINLPRIYHIDHITCGGIIQFHKIGYGARRGIPMLVDELHVGPFGCGMNSPSLVSWESEQHAGLSLRSAVGGGGFSFENFAIE